MINIDIDGRINFRGRNIFGILFKLKEGGEERKEKRLYEVYL